MKKIIYLSALFTYLIIGCESIKNPPLKLEGVSGLKTYSRAQFEALVSDEIDEGLFPVLKTDGEFIPFKFNTLEESWESVTYYFPEGDEYFKVIYRKSDNLPEINTKHFE
ncbi:hypothetical protein [Reichenbachiella versicolor]|uniref:hypothetical protein n=1 Tax=Reichenbachiella versicolor TaxID=1821036 RepID=UPI000D6E4699|nr:hypothetical protein [Reichenbachiella versicolor]